MTEQSQTRGILKKITVKTCGVKPDLEKLIAHKNANGDKAVFPLLTVYGVASDYKAGAGKDGMGDYVKFLGQFKAINVQTGQVFVSGACILPGAAPDLIYGALRGLGDNGGAVEFGFNIGASYDPEAVTKYVYHVDQIMSPDQADPLAALEMKLKALPAPAAAQEAPQAPQPDAGKKGKR